MARMNTKRKVRSTRSGATAEEPIAALESVVENAAEQGPEVEEPNFKKAKIVDEPVESVPGDDEPIVMEKLLSAVEEQGQKEIEAEKSNEDSKKEEEEEAEGDTSTDEYKQAKESQEETSEESAVNSEEEKDDLKEEPEESKENGQHSDEQQLKKKKQAKPAATRILPRRAARASPLPVQTNGASSNGKRQGRSMASKSVVSTTKKGHEELIQFEFSDQSFSDTLKSHKIPDQIVKAVKSTLASMNIRLKVTIEPMMDGDN